jgi:putative peptidoglycan lipid II flippase
MQSNLKSHNLHSSIVQRITLLSFGMLLGRVSGFIREWVVARQFKTSASADLFSLAVIFPEMLTNLLSSTSIGAVLYLILRKEQFGQSIIVKQFSVIVLRISAISFFILCGIVIVRFSAEPQYILILCISLLSVFPNGLAAAYTAVLHYYGRAKVQASSTLIFNTMIIAGLLLAPSIALAGWLILAAALMRMAVLWLELKQVPDLAPAIQPQEYALPAFSFRSVCAGIGIVSVSQLLPLISPFVDRLAASFGAAGNVAVLSYAEKLCMLPATLVLTIVPYAAAPEIYRYAENDPDKKLSFYVGRALQATLLLGLISAGVFYYFSYFISDLVFSYAKLPPASILRVADGLKGYALILPFIGPFTVLSTVLLAKNLRRELAVFSLQAVALKFILLLMCAFIGPEPRYIGLTSACAYFYLNLRFFSLYRTVRNPQ